MSDIDTRYKKQRIQSLEQLIRKSKSQLGSLLAKSVRDDDEEADVESTKADLEEWELELAALKTGG